MSKLEKCVCVTYICLAIVLGGLAAYCKITFGEINYSSLIARKDKKPSDVNVNTTNNNESIEKVLTAAPKVPIKAELTAYCNCAICSEAWGSETAMQTHTRVGTIAVPKNIQLGSKIYIPDLKDYKDDGIFDAEDRGGAVKVKSDGTYIIDVWLPTHEQVKEFGRKKTTVYLIK